MSKSTGSLQRFCSRKRSATETRLGFILFYYIYENGQVNHKYRLKDKIGFSFTISIPLICHSLSFFTESDLDIFLKHTDKLTTFSRFFTPQ